MKLRIINAINEILDNRFKTLLRSGAFPDVKWSEEGMWKSYSLFEYSNTYARFAKLVDQKMKVELDPQLGVFTRKHSAPFLASVQAIVDKIGEAEITINPERFRSFADAVIENA
jgi:hypothetical protein